jgi:hypothetical protein
LKLVKTSRFCECTLAYAIAEGIKGTRLGETQHDLISHQLRLLHLLLPVLTNKLRLT